MKKLTIVLLLICLLPGLAEAQAKNPLKSWKFWLETAAVAGIRIWDAESTVAAVRRDPFFRESNSIFSRRPKRGELYWKGGLITLGERGLIALIWKKNPKVGSALSSMDAGLNVTFHSFAIDANNSSQPPVCPSGTECNLK